MKLPTKTLEKKLLRSGYKFICAVDEVGMGSLAGPVVVCAVLLNKRFFKKRNKNLRWLRESKSLSSHQREKFVVELLKNKNLKYQIGYCFPKTIDRLNIYQAARLAMRRAVARLAVKPYSCKAIKPRGSKALRAVTASKAFMALRLKTIVLVDGPTKIKSLKLEQIPITKGDRKVFAIACASIIAKVYRDKMMINYAKRFPDYGFERHKGYTTKLHRTQLISLGPSLIHRFSFAPVTKLG